MAVTDRSPGLAPGVVLNHCLSRSGQRPTDAPNEAQLHVKQSCADFSRFCESVFALFAALAIGLTGAQSWTLSTVLRHVWALESCSRPMKLFHVLLVAHQLGLARPVPKPCLYPFVQCWLPLQARRLAPHRTGVVCMEPLPRRLINTNLEIE